MPPKKRTSLSSAKKKSSIAKNTVVPAIKKTKSKSVSTKPVSAVKTKPTKAAPSKTTRAKSAPKLKVEEKKSKSKKTLKAQKRSRSSSEGDIEEESPKKKRQYTKSIIPTIPNEYYRQLLALPIGTVLTMGQGSTGQLGLGAELYEKLFPGLVKDMDGEILNNIVNVVAGGMHSLCLTNEGKVYSFGCNDEGALGRITTCENDCFVPKLITALEDYVIVQVSAGDSHSVFLTNEGLIFATGTFRDANGSIGLVHPKRKEFTPVHIAMPCENRIRKIASGLDHLVCLTVGGQLITVGCADQGQLGRVSQLNAIQGGRKGLPYLLTPAFIQIVKRRTLFSDIWTGQYSTYAKALNKPEIWTCGLNNYYQIGFSDINSKYTLSKADAFKPKEGTNIKCISGGQHHALVLDNDGDVFSIGRHDYGRLGLGSIDKDISIPTQISKLDNISTISADTGVSFAIKNGDLYAWGMGSNNQLGTKEDDDILEPAIVKGKNIKDRKVISVSAGGQHVMVLASKVAQESVSSQNTK